MSIRLRHMSEAERQAFDRDPEAFGLALRFAARVAEGARCDTRGSAFTALMQVVEEARSHGVAA